MTCKRKWFWPWEWWASVWLDGWGTTTAPQKSSSDGIRSGLLSSGKHQMHSPRLQLVSNTPSRGTKLNDIVSGKSLLGR